MAMLVTFGAGAPVEMEAKAFGSEWAKASRGSRFKFRKALTLK